MPSHHFISHSTTPASCVKQALCVLGALLVVVGVADPAPLAVPVGTDFFGYDGLWSGVNIRVGGPSSQTQWLTVFPFTGSQETWVIGPGGCDGTETCQQERGGLFYKKESQTWVDQGYVRGPRITSPKLGLFRGFLAWPHRLEW